MRAALVAVLIGVVWGGAIAVARVSPPEQTRITALPKLNHQGVAPVVQSAAPAQPLGRKSVVTADMVVSAGFYATGAPAWNGGIHSGVDYAAAEGSPVYMPFDCAFLMTGFYGDAGRFGDYLMCYLADGSEYYSGHLQGVRSFAPGEVIPAGTHIGWTNALAHTHVQLRDAGGALVDFEDYYARH